MAHTRLFEAAAGAAARAMELSADLSALLVHCGHSSTIFDICVVGHELSSIATTLQSLHTALATDCTRYTSSFLEDLAEIVSDLSTVIEETFECCAALQKADNVTTSAGIYFLKKHKISHLRKHLTALATTLVVMETVVEHGKEHLMEV